MKKEEVLKLEFANDCHNPSGAGGGRFCSSSSVLGNVSFSDIAKNHPERVPGLNRMLKVIDSVHGLPSGFPKVDVEVWSAIGDDGGHAHGVYDPGSHLIKLSEGSAFNLSSFVHEFGHHISIGERGEGKMEYLNEMHNDPDLHAMHQAIRKTPQWKSMTDAEGSGSDHASYLKDPRELFARVYTQYIAQKSGSSILKFQIDKIQEITNGLYQWSDAEFAPIFKHMDAYFSKKGWLK